MVAMSRVAAPNRDRPSQKGSHRFKPYPAYKDSGIEWLGEIPEHWDSCILRRGFGVQGGFAFRSEDFARDGIPVVRMGNLKAGRLDLAEVVRVPEEAALRSFALQAGDLLVGMSGSISNYAWITESDLPCQLNQRVGRVSLRDDFGSLRFAMYVLHSLPSAAQIHLLAVGTAQQNISAWQLERLRVALPSKAEQRTIATFLDRETAKIDALVAKKERLIGLLHEKRSALIAQAVSKGLDANAPMKESGVEWLGEIPEHWEVKKVKRLCLVRRGASPRPIEDPIYFDDEGEYSWVRIADVTASEGYLERTTQRLSDLGRSKSVQLEPGELFVSIAATVGKPIVTKIKCCIHDGFVYFVGLRENRKYLYYIFSCGEPYKGLGKLGTQLNLNTDTIGDIYLPLPPGKEQEEIVRFLDCQTTKIDTLTIRIRHAIDRLKELRTALISSAVTGKIDVREEVA